MPSPGFRAWPSPGMSGVEMEMVDENDSVSEVQEQDLEPEVIESEGKGEEAAPPAETPEEHKRKGQEAALIAERRRRQELEREIAHIRQTQQPLAQPAEVQEGAPDPDKFTDYGEYLRAQARWEAKAVLNEERTKFAEMQARKNQETSYAVFQQAAEEKVNSGRGKFADFDQVINDGLAPFLTKTLHIALVDSEIGDEVSYYLGKNPREAERIANLQPYAAVREIGKLEAKLSAKPTTPTTQAPEPISPVGNRSRSSKGPADMTDAEYAKWRRTAGK